MGRKPCKSIEQKPKEDQVKPDAKVKPPTGQSDERESSWHIALKASGSQARVRDENCGKLAWDNAGSENDEDLQQKVERGLCHTVTDETDLNRYLPAVRGFPDFADARNSMVITWEDKNLAMAVYLGTLMYKKGR